MADGNWEVPEKELPSRDANSATAMSQLLSAGYLVERRELCRYCGIEITFLSGPSSREIECKPDGTLHVNCRGGKEPDPEPLPPVATFEQQQEKLDRLLGKK